MSVTTDFVAGMLSGAAAMLVEYPFDTVKVLLQVYGGGHAAATTTTTGTAATTARPTSPPPLHHHHHHHHHYTGYRDCFVTTYRQSGIRGFYRGVNARMLASAFDHACVFVSYKYTLRAIGADVERPTLTQICLGGCGSGLASTLCLTPFELVKCHMQADDCTSSSHRAQRVGSNNSNNSSRRHMHARRRYRSSWHCFRVLYREGGVTGLYRGGMAMLLREVPGTAAWCGTYDLMKSALTPSPPPPFVTALHDNDGSSNRHTTRPQLPLWKMMVAGGCSGVAFWTVFFPADVIKTRMQVDAHFARLSLAQALVAQYKEGGVRALYRGWALTALRSFPSNAILFCVFDVCSHHLAARRLRGYSVKHGLDELRDLDVVPVSSPSPSTSPPRQRPRSSEYADDATDKATRPCSDSDDDNDDRRRDKDSDGGRHDARDASRALRHAVHATVFGADWDEWRRVKDALFPAGTNKSKNNKSSNSNSNATSAASTHDERLRAKQAALDTIDVWHARARKARPLPPYVEATQLLCACVLLDEAASATTTTTTTTTTASSSSLSSLWLPSLFASASMRQQHYSASLSRVVHIMTGSFATRAADGTVLARTYRQRARRIAFPAEAVEVRQRVAHGSALPSLDELRWVCSLVLQYLYTHYWLVQAAHADDDDAAKRAHDNEATTMTAAAAEAEASLLHTSVDDMKAYLDELSSDDDEDDEEGEEHDDDDDDDDDADMTPAGWSVVA